MYLGTSKQNEVRDITEIAVDKTLNGLGRKVELPQKREEAENGPNLGTLSRDSPVFICA